MSNAIYPKYKEAVLDALANSDLHDGTVKVGLLDTATYTYNTAHQFYSDLSGVVGTPVALTTKTVTNGVFDADDATLSAVSGASAEALVIYIDTGTTTTSRLVAYIDTGVTGLPVTPNGGNITITWDNGSNKIFVL